MRAAEKHTLITVLLLLKRYVAFGFVMILKRTLAVEQTGKFKNNRGKNVTPTPVPIIFSLECF